MFRSLKLKAANLDELAGFYRGLGLAVTLSDQLVVQAGATELMFDIAAAGKPFYHFAFNIPENQIEQGRDWLQERGLGDGVIHEFASWNAHATYFFDPAGNILELIARHDLANGRPGPFLAESILSVSELGVVVADVENAVSQISRILGMEPYRPPADDFAAVGNEQSLFIVVKEGRSWFPTEMAARIYPAEAVLVESPKGSLPIQIQAMPQILVMAETGDKQWER